MESNVKVLYNELKTVLAKDRCTLISAALGWLGSINIMLIGIHVTTLYLHLAVLNRSFLAKAYMTGGIATVSTLALVFGSYLIWKDRAERGGGFLNFAGGIVTLTLCYYFTSIFPLLRQLEPIAYLLPAPALASGLLASFMLKSPSKNI